MMHSQWDDHPDYPVKDWQYEVANGDTRLGYWDWIHEAEVFKDEA
jgi:hypothetical protein